mgnify:FL=1
MRGNLHTGLGLETRQALTAKIATMWNDRTGQGLIDLLVLQVKKLLKDGVIVSESMGLEVSADHFQQHDYNLAKTALKTQWENLMTALASPSMATATDVLKSFNGVLSSMVQTVRGADPNKIKAVMMGIVLASTAMLTVGTALLGLAVFGGGGLFLVVASGIAALVGALMWFGAVDTANMKAGIIAVTAVVAGLGLALLGLSAPIAAVVAGIGLVVAGLVAFGGAIEGFLAKLGLTGRGVQGDGLGTPGPGMGLSDGMIPQRWEAPARGGGVQQINVPLYIDGHQIGEAVAYHIAKGNTHVDAAAQFDASRHHAPVDLQFA